MLAKMIDKIVSLKETKIFEIDGQTYADASLTRIPPHVDRPDCISVSGLDSICKLIRTELEKVGTTIMVQVKSNDTVEVMTTYLSDFSRNTLYRAKAATHFDGHKGYGNVLSISRSGNELHPTQKPVELLEKLVDNTDFATGVYDPFGGSGTTLAACEAYGQPSYIMELTPAFTDVIVKRYIRITGKTTVRCVRQGRELPREEIAAIFEPDEEGGEQE